MWRSKTKPGWASQGMNSESGWPGAYELGMLLSSVLERLGVPVSQRRRPLPPKLLVLRLVDRSKQCSVLQPAWTESGIELRLYSRECENSCQEQFSTRASSRGQS